MLDLTDRPYGSEPYVIDCMKRCWAEEPCDRPTMGEIKVDLKKMK